MPELTKIQTGLLDAQGPFHIEDGHNGAPGIAFEGDTDTGLTRSADGEISVVSNSTTRLKANANSLHVEFDHPVIEPTLNFDFANTRTLDPRISFRRDSIGTYVDENGYIKTASNNEPRFDHDPLTGESLGLLHEKESKNIIQYSDDFSLWAYGGTVTPSYQLVTTVLNPGGEYSTYELNEGTGTGWGHTNKSTVSADTGTSTTTYSIFVKAGTSSHAAIRLSVNSDAVRYACMINLSTGVVSGATQSPINYSSKSYGNGWWRVSITGSNSSGNVIYASIGPSDGTAITTSLGFPEYTKTGRTIYVWGAQVEQVVHPTSYIPGTTTSSVTRRVEDVKITGSNFTSWYNPNEMTLYAEGRSATGSYDSDGNPALISIDDNTTNNRLILRRWDPDGATQRSGFTFRYRRADISLNLDAFPHATTGYDATGDLPAWEDESLHKMAFGINNNSQVPHDIAGYGDGINANFAVTIPGGYTATETLTPYTAPFQMRFGVGAASAASWSGTISKVQYYNKRLSNDYLSYITS